MENEETIDYFKQCEYLLYSVPKKEEAVEILKKRQEFIIKKSCPSSGAVGVDYSKPYCKGSFKNETLNDLCELSDVRQRAECLREEVKIVKEAVERIQNADEKECLKLWYFKCMPKEMIAEQLERWSTKTIYNLKNRAVTSFAIIYYGIQIKK